METITHKKPSRLGRGLDALLGGSLDALNDAREELKHLPVDLLRRGKYQPRTRMGEEALQELANSIRAQGVVQPIVVRPVAEGGYEIVAGERRWRAAQMAGLQNIPAVVRQIPDEAAIAISLIENIQRENLNPIEEANALQRLIDEFGMTHQQSADSVGRSRAAVSNLLRLLSLNEDVRIFVEDGKIDMGHARALLALTGLKQSEIARQVAEKQLSVRETESLVRRLTEGTAKRGKTPPVSPDVRALTDSLSEKLGARVHLQQKASGKGRLIIEFGNNEALDGILAHLH